MANKIGLITKWSTEMFDEAYVAEARSSVLDANHGLLKFTGAKTVRFPKWSGDGLYNYNRANTMTNGIYADIADANGKGYGFQQGDATLEWEERTMKVERGVQYRIDAFDDEETEQLAVATSTGQINKQKIIPEVDAYCFSQIVYEACSTDRGNLVTRAGDGSDADKPLHLLNTAITKLRDDEVDDGDMVAFISNSFDNELRETNEVTKWMRQEDFNKNVAFTIKQYEDIPLITVPKRRFYTDVTLGAGTFYPSSTSKAIDVLLVAKSAVYHVVKYNKVKVFSPEVVQDFNGYKVNALIYHDVFVPDNKKIACYCILAATANQSARIAATNIQLFVDMNKHKLAAVSLNPGSTAYGSLAYTTTAPTVGSAPTSATAIAVFDSIPTDVTGTVYICALDDDGKVIAYVTKTLA